MAGDVGRGQRRGGSDGGGDGGGTGAASDNGRCIRWWLPCPTAPRERDPPARPDRKALHAAGFTTCTRCTTCAIDTRPTRDCAPTRRETPGGTSRPCAVGTEAGLGSVVLCGAPAGCRGQVAGATLPAVRTWGSGLIASTRGAVTQVPGDSAHCTGPHVLGTRRAGGRMTGGRCESRAASASTVASSRPHDLTASDRRGGRTRTGDSSGASADCGLGPGPPTTAAVDGGCCGRIHWESPSASGGGARVLAPWSAMGRVPHRADLAGNSRLG